MEFSIVVESITLDEGADWARFRASLAAAVDMIPEDKSGEVLVVDNCGLPELEDLLNRAFPQVKRISAHGLGYDRGKMLAATLASGKYLLYLDGDCLPQPGWHAAMMECMRSGQAVACGGYTRYEGGFMAAVGSVMDFGFLYPRISRPLDCYASNNCGFLREWLNQNPMPEVDMRCSCYAHTQQCFRDGFPVMMVPEAFVLHERQPQIRERTRQGYDAIAACWVDPKISANRFLRFGILAAPIFYAMNVMLDWRRVWIARVDLDLTFLQALGSMLLFPFLRLLDLAGMLRAIMAGSTRGGWGGWLAKLRHWEHSAGR
jgi:glycosyltransferase involved in cell wall biosynthesis